MVEIDYEFYSREGEQVEGRSKLVTVLNRICTSTLSRFACQVRTKGNFKGLDEHTVTIFCQYLQRLHHPCVMLKFDDEKPIKAFAEKVQSRLGSDKVQLRGTPRYSSTSLGRRIY